MAEGSKRLYVGNLHPEISEKEVRDRFNKFGKVANVEIKHKTDIDGKPTQTFSFVDIHMSDNDVTGCISTLANTNWKGYSMRIQQAKESFMSRLARERKEKENQGTMQGTPGTPGTPVYNPLSLVKSRMEGDGGEQKRRDELKTDRPTVPVNKPERKRFLGGERDPQEGGRNAPSGNYTRLGRRDLNQEPRSLDPSESRDYLPGRGSGSGSGYDPLSMIKRHMGGGQVVPDAASEAPAGPGVRVDEGSVNNGVVTFDEAEEKGPARKRKIYHSSDEEEDGGKVRTEPRKEQVKKKIKKVESAEVKAKKKAELKEKWEAKQKEKMKHDELEANKQNKKTKKDNSGARYYSSSEEEEEEEESNEPEKKDKLDGAAPEKASLSILKKFKSFSSSVWADSDQEEEEEEEDEEEEDNEKEEEEDVEEVNAEEERERNYAILSQVVGKNVQEPAQHKPRSLGLDYMPRFDPEASDPEDAAEDADDTTEDVEETKVEAGAPRVEISKNLKEALGKGSFSFGFRKSEPEQEIKPVKPELFHLDSDDETETVKKVADFSETFGNQLQGKIDENAESFFFIPDDERLKEGIQFFFHEREDLEKVRAEYNAKRPELAAIFKNKARSKAQLDRKNIKSRPKFNRFKSQRGRPNKHH